jgi:hypothetical protein
MVTFQHLATYGREPRTSLWNKSVRPSKGLYLIAYVIGPDIWEVAEWNVPITLR